MNRILIGALSAQGYADRRANCLDTWMQFARSPGRSHLRGINGVFLVGEPGRILAAREDRILYLPVPDDYPHLPMKTRAFCQWALTQPDWDYLFKCDDDTAIAITRLATYDTDGRDYIGAEWQPGVDYGSGGAGYLLSRRAAEIVAERMTLQMGNEDQEAGNVLRRAGIRLSIEPRFIPWGNMEKRPRPDNDLITAHAVGREVFEAVHREVDVPALAALGAA